MNFLLQTILSETYTVLVAKDVYDGMQLLRNRSNIDTIIIDIDNDTAENLEFVYHIKSSRLFSQCKILVLGSITKVEANLDELSGVDKIFHKPFSPQTLMESIKKINTLKPEILN